MRNKKAFLLGEYTLKTIIAVLSILLLLYLLFVFYSSFTEKKNFQRAESTLNDLSEKMIDAKTKAVSLPLLEPNGWVLVSYSEDVLSPDSCSGDCICLCEPVNWKDNLKVWAGATQVDKCNIRGACKNFDNEINEIEIKLRADISIEYEDGGYVIEEISE